MAFYECIDKVKPNITPETLTGSICSFNDEYGGLPLKSCTSLISGYQEGSGIPSPQNVRPLHAFSSGTLTANGNTTTFTFGQSIYQGYIDWKRGVVVGNVIVDTINNINLERTGTAESGVYRFVSVNEISTPTPNNEVNENLHCEFLNTVTNNNTYSMQQGCAVGSRGNLYFFVDSSISTVTYFVNAYGDYKIAYPLATPIEIPLGGVNLITQQGQNNIFADCGDTTVEYIKIN